MIYMKLMQEEINLHNGWFVKKRINSSVSYKKLWGIVDD